MKISRARLTFGTMAVSAVIGAMSVTVGLFAARQWALAPGGSIVLVAAITFAIVSLVGGRRRGGLAAVLPGTGRAEAPDHDAHDHHHG